MKSREELLTSFDTKYALFGLFFAFGNRLQAVGDSFYEEITCKQFFLLICLNLFPDEAPTINELSDVMGCSHQNAKQIVLKLEKLGFVTLRSDEKDKRKIRIYKSDQLDTLSEKNAKREEEFMEGFYQGIAKEDVETAYRVMLQLENNLMKMKDSKTNKIVTFTEKENI